MEYVNVEQVGIDVHIEVVLGQGSSHGNGAVHGLCLNLNPPRSLSLLYALPAHALYGKTRRHIEQIARTGTTVQMILKSTLK